MPTEWNAVLIGAATLLALGWLVPLLGMLLVYLFHQVDNAPRGPAEPPFGGGAGGPPQGAA